MALPSIQEVFDFVAVNVAAFQPSDGLRNFFQIIGVIVAIAVALGFFGHLINWWNFRKKEFPNLIMINFNTVEKRRNGDVFLRPRTVVPESRLSELFHDPVVASWIVRAAKKLSVDKSLIVLDNPDNHTLMMKQMRNRVSTLAVDGHLRRMAGQEVDINHCWCALTYESYGEGHSIRMLRIQVIMQDDLKLFCDAEFVKKLKFTLGEGGHVKEAHVLQILAEKQYENASEKTMGPGEFETKETAPELCFVVLPTKLIGK